MQKFRPKQKLFCEEYLKDLNATQAALRAGYSPKTAAAIGLENLEKPIIKEFLAEKQAERSKRTGIDADYVLNRLAAIDKMDVADVLNDDGTIKAISLWPDVWRQSLSGFEIAELFNGQGQEKTISGILKKIKLPDKLKNLELLGKHVTVGAFKETLENKHSFLGPDGKPLDIKLTTVYVSVGSKGNG
jgi:phage terminase small subunit